MYHVPIVSSPHSHTVSLRHHHDHHLAVEDLGHLLARSLLSRQKVPLRSSCIS
jgi:hypothetical protein